MIGLLQANLDGLFVITSSLGPHFILKATSPGSTPCAAKDLGEKVGEGTAPSKQIL
jgi:hypothetical protein